MMCLKVALLVAIALGGCTAAPDVVQRTAAFQQLSNGYKTFRIPSIVVAADGSFLVFAEGRAPVDRPAVGNTTVCWGQPASLYDWQCYAKDIVMRRSQDNGKTFSHVVTLAASNASFLYTNPLAVVDTHTSTAWLAYVRCPIPPGAPPGHSAYVNCTQLLRKSTDNGNTWEAELEIPGSRPMHDEGVGAGLQLRSGTLVFPRNGAGMLRSTDHGLTWSLGKRLPEGGESQAVELADGSVIQQLRMGAKKYQYWWCRSHDEGATFGSKCESRSVPLVPDIPTSIVRRGDVDLWFSHPNSARLPCPYGRTNMTISISHDSGVSWNDQLQVFSGPSGYSSLVNLPSGQVGLLYEKSDDGKLPIDFEEIELAIINP